MAFLLLEPRIKAAGRISCETQVKSWFKDEGCLMELYTTQLLQQVRRGVKNTLPLRVDKSGALFLTLLTYDRSFQVGTTNGDCLLQFSTIIGFIGMLRPQTFEHLRPSSITLVSYTGRCQTLPDHKHRYRADESYKTCRYLGVLYHFQEQNEAECSSLLP